MRPTVAIIGAGPGGATAAIELGRRGLCDVVLLDKDTFPRDKTCGSGLSPNALTMLDELGLGSEVREKGYAVGGLRLITPGKREMILRSEGAAVILLRKHLDNLLVEKAQESGARLRTGFHARALIEEHGRVVGVRSSTEEVRADYVLCADGAHSIFSRDPRPKRTISTLMGWWEGMEFEPHLIEMIFDRNLAPLYGWMFPETDDRVNIGICIDGEEDDGTKQRRNVREVFQRFLDDYYGDRIKGARQLGRWKGHPISYTTWIDHAGAPGVIQLGEAARITHNATGEGIYQAMQSGRYAADAVARILTGDATEGEAQRAYTWICRRRFTTSFLVGHLVRGLVKTPLLDQIAGIYNDERIRGRVSRALSFVLAGSAIPETAAPAAPATPQKPAPAGVEASAPC
ncbi:MAG: NAD(P)/FAD-dependent oxidoreductase [Byssovorax sp.]